MTGLPEDPYAEPGVDAGSAPGQSGREREPAGGASLFGPADGYLGAPDTGSVAAAAPPPAASPPAASPPAASPPAASQPAASQPADAKAPQRRTTGMSAIRAQSVRGQLLPTEDPAGEAGAPKADWLLRTPDGTIQRFPDFDRVRAWLAANPGVEATLSSDGITWRAPERILAMDGEPAPERPVARLPRGPSGALRPEAAAQVRRRRPAGRGWTVAALVSTLLFAGTAVYTVQNLGLADLSGVIPFHAVGLGHLAVPPAQPKPPADQPEPPAPDPDRVFADALKAARGARRDERLVEAAVAYQRALSHREDPEALAELVETYALLGDADRADDARRRLARLRDAPEQQP